MKREYEAVYIDILNKLQDICIRNNIKMWLTGYAALSVYRDGCLAGSDLAVCVTAKDALLLEKSISAEADDTFCVESPLNNDRFPKNELRVLDPRTTDCDTLNFFKYNNNCMHITVKLAHDPAEKQGPGGKIIRKLSRKLRGSASEFESWCKSQKTNAPELQPVELYGRTFYIPADSDGFFTNLFGPGWQYFEQPEFISSDKHFLDAEYGWKEWAADLPEADVSSYRKTLKEYREHNAGHRDAQKELTGIHNIVDQSFDRIQMLKMFFSREDELKRLVKEECFDELEAILLPYLKKLKLYYDKGLSLYVDDALTEVADTLLRHKGMNSFADETSTLITEDKNELILTDHHGKPLGNVPESIILECDTDDTSGGQLSETQKRLLDMMKRIHGFLTEKGIEYFLFGGSLLGAVRHEGFIPWDDDMDIVMDRKNYNKLVEISDSLPWDDIAFDCCEKNPEFHKPFGMFTLLTDTRFVNDRVYFGGAGLGTGIDVFIMDNVPWDHLDEYIKSSLLYQELQTDETIQSADILKYKDEYFSCKARMSSEEKIDEITRLKAEMEKYGQKKEDDLQVVRLWTRKPRIYEPGMMEDPILHKFEDADFYIPARAIECLEMQYGSDWNVIPPREERQVHAFKIDYDLAAINYYRLVDKAIDWDRASRALEVRKKSRINALDKKLALDAFRKTLYSKYKNK